MCAADASLRAAELQTASSMFPLRWEKETNQPNSTHKTDWYSSALSSHTDCIYIHTAFWIIAQMLKVLIWISLLLCSVYIPLHLRLFIHKYRVIPAAKGDIPPAVTRQCSINPSM